VTALLGVVPLICVAVAALAVYLFVESLPYGAPRPRLADRLREMDPEYWAGLDRPQSLAPRPVQVGWSILRPAINAAGRLFQQLLARLGYAPDEDLTQSLALLRPGVTPLQHVGEKLLIGLLGLGFFPIVEVVGIHPFGPSPLWLWLVLGGAGFLAPDWYLKQKRTERRTRIVMELPVILSLLAMALRAGHSIAEALGQVADGSEGELAADLQRVRRDLALGVALGPALLAMSRRSRIPEIATLVGHIHAADALGLPLVVALRTQASALREQKRMRIVEEGGKGSIRMVLPVALFILPVLFVIVLAPAAATVGSWGS